MRRIKHRTSVFQIRSSPGCLLGSFPVTRDLAYGFQATAPRTGRSIASTICTLAATLHPTGGGIQTWSFCRGDDPACGVPLLAWLATSGSAGDVTCARSGLLGGAGLGGRGGRQFAVGDDVGVDAEGTRFMDNPS
jgi:hypothetical protein